MISASTCAVAPRPLDHRQIDIALGRVFDPELFARQAGLLQETVQRRLGRIELGAFQLLAHVLLFRRKTRDGQGQPPGPRESLGAFEQITPVGQRTHHQPFQVTRGAALHARRNFLAE